MTRLAPVVINGRYELQRKLGRGGTADIYLARDQKLDRAVTVKVLFPALATDPGFVERFRGGAQAAAGLDHPNIVTVYDWGEANGRYFVVMEHVEGESLAELIARDGRLDPNRAAEIAADIASALGFAQRDGDVVHRDVKPANVLVTREGGVKVTDFDVARAVGDPSEGTPGAEAVHSLGCVLYEMLVGRAPSGGESAVAPPRRIDPAIPETLEAITLKSLAKNPANRYPSAKDMRADLRRYLEGARIVAQPTAAPVADPDATEILSGVDHMAPTETMKRTTAAPTRAVASVHGLDGGSDGGSGGPGGSDGSDGDEDGIRERLRPYAVLIVLVVVLVVMGALLLLATRDRSSGGNDATQDTAGVTVPRVVDMQQADAEAALEQAGLVATVETAANDTVPAGTVVGQDPAANASLAPGSAVTLTVSSGPATNAIPDLKGKTRDEAMDALTELGFVPSPKEVESATVAEGLVVDTNPPAGTPAAHGTTVEIQVSAGSNTTAVPDVTNQPEAQARATLEGVGFTVATTPQPNDSVPPGTALGTNPGPGTMAANGSTITLIVAAPSGGGQLGVVPDVVGQDESAARSQLEGAGFQVTTTDQPVDRRRWDGQVIAQNPPGGTPAPPGSMITLVIGRHQDPGFG